MSNKTPSFHRWLEEKAKLHYTRCRNIIRDFTHVLCSARDNAPFLQQDPRKEEATSATLGRILVAALLYSIIHHCCRTFASRVDANETSNQKTRNDFDVTKRRR